MSKSRGSDAVSPTAYYTGDVWNRHGLSHPAFLTREGQRYHRLAVLTGFSRLSIGRELEDFLLARHRIIDHLLTEAIDSGRVSQVVEIAAGLSPRGWRFSQRYGERLAYIEADLPQMAERKRRLLADSGIMGARHRVVALDALAVSGPRSLAAITDSLDMKRGVAIVTEGLLNYLDRNSVIGLWRRIASMLRRFPDGIYLSDLHVTENNVGGATAVFGALLSAFVRGRVHLHFHRGADAEAALRDAGFGRARLLNPLDVPQMADGPVGPGARRVRVIDAAR